MQIEPRSSSIVDMRFPLLPRFPQCFQPQVPSFHSAGTLCKTNTFDSRVLARSGFVKSCDLETVNEAIACSNTLELSLA